MTLQLYLDDLLVSAVFMDGQQRLPQALTPESNIVFKSRTVSPYLQDVSRLQVGGCGCDLQNRLVAFEAKCVYDLYDHDFLPMNGWHEAA